MSKVTVALSKGRILKDTLPILEACGLTLLDDPHTSRKLVFETNHPNVEVIIVRATDVPTFVSYGAADLGIAGKDILLESGAANLFEAVDLDIAKCKLMVAVMNEFVERYQSFPKNQTLRVATKFTQLTQAYFDKRHQPIELIKLYGSMELAPIVKLADCIVDIVDTGNTLRANGLTPLEHVVDVSSRVIVNKASWMTKQEVISPLIEGFKSYVASQ